jgi:aryl carrier-like protein
VQDLSLHVDTRSPIIFANSLGSDKLNGQAALSDGAALPGTPGSLQARSPSLFTENSGPISKDKLEKRQQNYFAMLRDSQMIESTQLSRPGQHGQLHALGSQTLSGGVFGSLNSPMADGGLWNDSLRMETGMPVSRSTYSLGLGPQRRSSADLFAMPSSGGPSAEKSSPCLSRSFSWPYCFALANLDLQAPSRGPDGRLRTPEGYDGVEGRTHLTQSVFVSTELHHLQVLLDSVRYMALQKRMRARRAGGCAVSIARTARSTLCTSHCYLLSSKTCLDPTEGAQLKEWFRFWILKP